MIFSPDIPPLRPVLVVDLPYCLGSIFAISSKPLYTFNDYQLSYEVVSDCRYHGLPETVVLYELFKFLSVFFMLLVLSMLYTRLCEVYFLHQHQVLLYHLLHILFFVNKVEGLQRCPHANRIRLSAIRTLHHCLVFSGRWQHLMVVGL